MHVNLIYGKTRVPCEAIEFPPHYRTFTCPENWQQGKGWDLKRQYIKLPYIQFYYIIGKHILLTSSSPESFTNSPVYQSIFIGNTTYDGRICWGDVKFDDYTMLGMVNAFWMSKFEQILTNFNFTEKNKMDLKIEFPFKGNK